MPGGTNGMDPGARIMSYSCWWWYWIGCVDIMFECIVFKNVKKMDVLHCISHGIK